MLRVEPIRVIFERDERQSHLLAERAAARVDASSGGRGLTYIRAAVRNAIAVAVGLTAIRVNCFPWRSAEAAIATVGDAIAILIRR